MIKHNDAGYSDTYIRAPEKVITVDKTQEDVSATFATRSIGQQFIKDLKVETLLAGTITSKTYTLAVEDGKGDVYFAAGKTDFTNTDSGFILGVDDSDSDTPKFYIGNSSNYLNWTGSALNISGSITATSGTIGGWTIGATTITGGNVTLDSTGNIRFGKTSFADTANAGLIMGLDGATPKLYFGTASDASYLKLSGSVYELVGEISGRSTLTIASAINSSGNLITDIINAKLDSSTKKILSDFNFGTADYAGGVKAGDIAWNTTTGAITGGSGVVVYRGGIVGASAGVATFSIDATTGSATFAGTLSAPTGAIGGWTIASTTLTGGNTTLDSSGVITLGTSNDIVKLSSVDATYRIWVGHATAGSAPFRVTKAGDLTATSATITGALTTGAGSTINGTYIDSLTVSKLIAGTITSKAITLAVSDGSGDTYIAAGKTDFDNTVAGFILGVDDSDSNLAKFYIGNTTSYFNWTGSAVTVQGTINGSSGGFGASYNSVVIESTGLTVNTGADIAIKGDDTDWGELRFYDTDDTDLYYTTFLKQDTDRALYLLPSTGFLSDATYVPILRIGSTDEDDNRLGYSQVEIHCAHMKADDTSTSQFYLYHAGPATFSYVSRDARACTAALAGAGAGNLSNGAYKYKVTFVTAEGDSGGQHAGVSNTVTVTDNTTNGRVSLTSIPTWNTGTTYARKIYRTQANGSIYYLLATISDNTTTTYTDNIADGSLGAEINATNNTGKEIIFFGGGIYLHELGNQSASTDLAAPATNQAVLYLRDNGAGKSQLCVRFATGAVQVIEQEP